MKKVIQEGLHPQPQNLILTKMDAAQSRVRQFDPSLITELKSIITKYTDRPDLLTGIESLAEDTDISFIKLLNIDSVDVVEIVVDIEDRYNIVIEDEELKAFKSFGDMYDLIEQKLSL